MDSNDKEDDNTESVTPRIKYMPPKKCITNYSYLGKNQSDLTNFTQGIYHKYALQHKTFDFKAMTNEPNLTHTSRYYERPLNNGLLVHCFTALCVIVMYLYFSYLTAFRCKKSKCIVCIFKILIAILGLPIFLLGFLEFYSHMGLFFLWYAADPRKFILQQQKNLCNSLKIMKKPVEKFLTEQQKPFKDFLDDNTEDNSTLELLPPDLVDGIKFIANANFTDLDANKIKVANIFTVLCEAKNVTVWLGKKNFFDLMDQICTKYALLGVIMSVFTIILGYCIMRTFCKNSKNCLTIICILSILTIIFWWVVASFSLMFLIGISDFNIRRADGIQSIMVDYDGNVTREFLQQFLDCENADGKWPMINKIYKASFPIVDFNNTAYNGTLSLLNVTANLTYELEPIETGFNTILEFLHPMFCIWEQLYRLYFKQCDVFKGIFENGIGRPIGIYFYWAILVGHFSAVALAILLTAFIILALTIMNSANTVCRIPWIKSPCMPTRKKLVACPEECTRYPHLTTLRKRCPTACLGTNLKNPDDADDTSNMQGPCGDVTEAEIAPKLESDVTCRKPCKMHIR